MSVTPEQIDIWRTSPSENQRLEFKEAKTFSQVIGYAIEAQAIKPDETVGGSRKYARYLPIWA